MAKNNEDKLEKIPLFRKVQLEHQVIDDNSYALFSSYIKLQKLFVIVGIIFLLLSIIDIRTLLDLSSSIGNKKILAFIGLTLVFFGGILFMIRPNSHVNSSLLSNMLESYYHTIDRIVRSLEHDVYAYYIPSYPREVNISEHLKGLKEITVFISDNNNYQLPKIEARAKRRFDVTDPNGVIISPPGLGLMNQFEQELRNSFFKLDLLEIIDFLPIVLKENLRLVDEMTISNEKNQLIVEMTNSSFREVYEQADLLSPHYLGCPIVSAIACALSINTSKIVSITEIILNTESNIITAFYQLRESEENE